MNSGRVNSKFFIIVGAVILGLFISISIISLADRNDYYNSMDVIKKIEYTNNKLVITTSDDISSVCVKGTKSEPTVDSLCWVNTIDNKSITSIYEYKTYHIWIKDSNDSINYYGKYNVQDN